MVVLAVIAAAGAAAWIYQTMFGLGVTGMNNGTSWGLYIARRWRFPLSSCPRCASAARACWSSSTSAAWRASST